MTDQRYLDLRTENARLQDEVNQLKRKVKRYTDWFECMAASMNKLSEQERRAAREVSEGLQNECSDRHQ